MTLNEKWSSIEPKIDDRIVKAIHDGFGFEYVMPVQKVVLPHFMQNHDVAVQAATGSGKTLSFVIPMTHHAIKNKTELKPHEIFGLIIAPTRELAKQIHEVYSKLLEALGKFRVQLLIGGSNIEPDKQAFKELGANFIIATPGKLKEMMNSKVEEFSFKNLNLFVMDEADRLLAAEYQEDMSFILSLLPKQRRTGIFSATLDSIEKSSLKKLGLRNPLKIDVQVNTKVISKNGYEEETKVNNLPKGLKNYYMISPSRAEKFTFLINFLISHKDDKIILFFNTCASVSYYSKVLSELEWLKGLNMTSIHGQMKQKKRNKIYDSFVQWDKGLLVATDVVARGIDLPDVNWIIQFDPPQDPNFYVHRVGRTARAGREGTALLLLLPHEEAYIPFMKNKNIEAEKYEGNDDREGKLSYEDIQKEIMKIQLDDKDIIEKGKSAFVSFVRSYKEHDLKYIFEFSKLSLGDTANSFFLITMPRIKEILGKKLEDFLGKRSLEECLGEKIDLESVKFKDKNQEKQYLIKKESAVVKREQREQAKKEMEKKLKIAAKERPKSRSQKKRAKKEVDMKDFADFCAEERLVKKLKKGLISAKEFNRKMKEIDGDDYDDDNDDE